MTQAEVRGRVPVRWWHSWDAAITSNLSQDQQNTRLIVITRLLPSSCLELETNLREVQKKEKSKLGTRSGHVTALLYLSYPIMHRSAAECLSPTLLRLRENTASVQLWHLPAASLSLSVPGQADNVYNYSVIWRNVSNHNNLTIGCVQTIKCAMIFQYILLKTP